MEEDKLLTYAEVAEKFGFKLGTLYALVAKNDIPHLRIRPKMVRFHSARIRAWLKSKEVPLGGSGR